MALGAVTNTLSHCVAPDGRERSRLDGLLDLDFRSDPVSGRTALVRSLQIPPLRVVRAFHREDGSALAHLHNVSGGVLGGDCLVLRAKVEREANAQLTTTGATRIYRPRPGSPPALQLNEIFVAQDALLEYVPDVVIPFAGARFLQRTTIHLADRAGLIWWEILAPGREASGEVLQYERVELSTNVLAAGRPIAAERMRLEPASRHSQSLGRLGEYRYLASFYICRVGLAARAWLVAEQQLRELARAITRLHETVWAISTLPADGLVVRCLALRGRDAVSGLRTIWQAAKLLVWNRPAILPRKVS